MWSIQTPRLGIGVVSSSVLAGCAVLRWVGTRSYRLLKASCGTRMTVGFDGMKAAPGIR